MADDDFFFPDDMDNIDLDEEPSFDFGEEELLPQDDSGGGGTSRTFLILGGVMIIAVVIIVILLIVFALGGDSLTPNQKTSTAVAEANASVTVAYGQTLIAIDNISTATAAALATFNAESTATQFAFETQQAELATSSALTATADFFLGQTATAVASEQAATQQVLDMTATAQALTDRTVSGQIVNQAGQAFGNSIVILYRDNGDGEFNPPPTPTPAATGGSGAGTGTGDSGAVPGGGQLIEYGQAVQATLETGGEALWTFTGATGHTVLIAAVASDPVQMDMFLELIGPDGTRLVSDDDSGGESDAAIMGFALPGDGEYTIRVTSVAAGGDYTLSLSLGLSVPNNPVPTQDTGAGTDDSGTGTDSGTDSDLGTDADTDTMNTGWNESHVLARPAMQATPTPEGSGDQVVDQVQTDADGNFDFGAVDPGIYWLVLDYDSLPNDLKAMVNPADAPFVVMVNVPTGGAPITFTIQTSTAPTITPGGETDTPTPAISDTPGTPGLMTATPTEEPGALPTTGFFSDIGDSSSNIKGSSGLAILAIAAAGLVAVVFIARKLRTSA
ncbi:MAG: hypothetical protein JXQ72_12850 [Anaerolineae bacterium]|nr:hypothetical protein [Anaerolineae bacterium]